MRAPRTQALIEAAGYAAEEWTALGWVHPNPPLQNNRCHTFLARGAQRVGEPQPDPNERIEQALVPLSEIPQRIAEREITHALVITAFQLYGQR